MRPTSLCAGCLSFVAGLILCGQIAAAEAPEPSCTTAQVAAIEAQLRSGPGESYYPTDALVEGAEVEIYQRRPDGWCAIRPPESSFSWVFARHVVPLGDGLGRIDKEGVPARIGSNLSQQRDVTQVLLDRGEIVRIVDEQLHEGQTWYKIAPPAGEFRWIHQSSIRSEEAPLEPVTAESTEWRPVAKSNRHVLEAPAKVASDGVTLASTVSAPPLATSGEAGGTASAGNTTTGEIDRQVAGLELRLSRMVAEPTSTWDIAPLEHDAEQLLSQAQTVADRETVQATLTKIDRFAAIHRRYLQNGGIATVAQNSAATPGGAAAAGEAGRYDAVGILRPVVSRRPGAPQFALVDERGQVVSFVTPSPDVNLQPYLGRRVGIVGMRGFMPEFRRNHVVAGRVSPLESNLVR